MQYSFVRGDCTKQEKRRNYYNKPWRDQHELINLNIGWGGVHDKKLLSEKEEKS
jgi:hypothetical protein